MVFVLDKFWNDYLNLRIGCLYNIVMLNQYMNVGIFIDLGRIVVKNGIVQICQLVNMFIIVIFILCDKY